MTSGRGIPEYGGAMNPRSELSLLLNRVECLCLPGKIKQIDYKASYARVEMRTNKGRGILTDWLRWTEAAAGTDREWNPPVVGELVLVMSPTGNINQGIITQRFNTLDAPPISDNPEINRKTWGKKKEDSFYAHPFWEMCKTKDKTHEYTYLPPKGEFRHEIGDKVLVHWTEDFLMWRIGNTQYVLRDGSAVVTICDNLAEPEKATELTQLTLTQNEFHVNTKGESSLTVQGTNAETEHNAAIELQVKGNVAITMTASSLRAGVAKDASLVMEAGAVCLESKSSKAQLLLKGGMSQMCLDGVACRLTPVVASLGSINGSFDARPGALSLSAIKVLGSSPEGVPNPGASPGYDSGPISANPRPALTFPIVKAKPRWVMEESKGPFYPRTQKPKN